MGFGLTKSAAVTAVLGTVPRAVLARVVVARARVRRPVLGRVWVAVRQVVVVVVLVDAVAVVLVDVAAHVAVHVHLPAAEAVPLDVQVTVRVRVPNKERVYDFVEKHQGPPRCSGCQRI